MKLVHLGLVASALMLAACQGDDGMHGTNGKDGAAAESSLNNITPSSAFPGRKVSLTISGDNTTWTAAPTVSFDDSAITVKSVEVASPTALLVEIEIGEAATFGSKTITVGEQTFKGFQVREAIGTELIGSTKQGSLSILAVRNNDSENLFSTAQSQNMPVGVQLQSSGRNTGVNFVVQSVEAQSADILVLVDANAPAAEHTVNVYGIGNVPFGSFKTNIETRAAEELTSSVTGVSLEPFGSKLYKISSPSFALHSLELQSDGEFAFVQLNSAGEWVDLDFQESASGKLEANEPVYFVVMNLGYDTASFDLDVSVNVPVAENEPNNSIDEAQELELGTVVYGSLESNTDVDFYKVTLAEDKKINAVTGAVTTGPGFLGPVPVDTLITVYNSSGDEVARSRDLTYPDSLLTEVLPAGDYYIKITHVGPINPPGNDYTLVVTAED